MSRGWDKDDFFFQDVIMTMREASNRVSQYQKDTTPYLDVS